MQKTWSSGFAEVASPVYACSTMRRPWSALFLLALGGCSQVSYLSQAARGQLSLLANARPLPRVLRDPKTDVKVARLLRQVPDLKRFGESRGLTATENYERYTDLHREAAVWVVQACQPLAFETKRWHFPIVGSVPYLGFFDKTRAQKFAATLKEHEDLDIDVRGASAYSTLGWFKDPLLSTMLEDGPEGIGAMANVILHESVHATFYLPGQSAFDESVASFVADRLTVEYLARKTGPRSPESTAWSELNERHEARVARLHRAYEELDALYKSPASVDDKRERKAAALAQLQTDLGTKRSFNNATLAGYRTYDTGSASFEALLSACRGDWRCFLREVATLTENDFASAQMEDFSGVVSELARRVKRQ